MVAALLAACHGPHRVVGSVVTRDSGLPRLDAAITAFDQARTRVLTSTADLVAAALALDAADEACAAGALKAAATARTRARAATPKGRTALAGLPMRLTAYAAALSELTVAAQAAHGLSDAQRQAVADVVTGGQAEHDAADAFGVAGRAAWPAYADLDAAQSTWLDRRLAGWYRDQQEAAAAYAVLVRDGRPALQRARTLLERVDAARRPVSERERAAVAAADVALASLRTPG